MKPFNLIFFIYLQQRADDEELRSKHSSAIFTTEMSGAKIESLQRSGLERISLAKTYKIFEILYKMIKYKSKVNFFYLESILNLF